MAKRFNARPRPESSIELFAAALPYPRRRSGFAVARNESRSIIFALSFALSLLGLSSNVSGQTQQLTIDAYYQDDGHGNCITWGGSDTACANLVVTVNGDAVPGDYTYDLLCNPDIIGDGGNVVRTCCGYGHQTTIHVNADHSYTVDPDPGLACMGNAGGKGLSHLYLSVSAPANSVHSEGDVNVNVDSIYCAGSPVTLYADIPVHRKTKKRVAINATV